MNPIKTKKSVYVSVIAISMIIFIIVSCTNKPTDHGIQVLSCCPSNEEVSVTQSNEEEMLYLERVSRINIRFSEEIGDLDGVQVLTEILSEFLESGKDLDLNELLEILRGMFDNLGLSEMELIEMITNTPSKALPGGGGSTTTVLSCCHTASCLASLNCSTCQTKNGRFCYKTIVTVTDLGDDWIRIEVRKISLLRTING